MPKKWKAPSTSQSTINKVFDTKEITKYLKVEAAADSRFFNLLLENNDSELIAKLVKLMPNIKDISQINIKNFEQFIIDDKYNKSLRHIFSYLELKPQTAEEIKYNTSLLHLTCRAGQIHNTRWLLDLGYSPNSQDRRGNTPLHEAVLQNSNTQIVTLLLNKKNTNIENNYALTPSVLACISEVSARKKGIQIKYPLGKDKAKEKDITQDILDNYHNLCADYDKNPDTITTQPLIDPQRYEILKAIVNQDDELLLKVQNELKNELNNQNTNINENLRHISMLVRISPIYTNIHEELDNFIISKINELKVSQGEHINKLIYLFHWNRAEKFEKAHDYDNALSEAKSAYDAYPNQQTAEDYIRLIARIANVQPSALELLNTISENIPYKLPEELILNQKKYGFLQAGNYKKALELSQQIKDPYERQLHICEVFVNIEGLDISALREYMPNILQSFEQLKTTATDYKLLMLNHLYYKQIKEFSTALEICELIFNLYAQNTSAIIHNMFAILDIYKITSDFTGGLEYLEQSYKKYPEIKQADNMKLLYYQYLFNESVGHYSEATKYLKKLDKYYDDPIGRTILQYAKSIRELENQKHALKEKYPEKTHNKALTVDLTEEDQIEIINDLTSGEKEDQIEITKQIVEAPFSANTDNKESDPYSLYYRKFHQFILQQSKKLSLQSIDQIREDKCWKIGDRAYSMQDKEIVKILTPFQELYACIDEKEDLDGSFYQTLINHPRFIKAASKNEGGIKFYKTQGYYKLKQPDNDLGLYTNKIHINNKGAYLLIFDTEKGHKWFNSLGAGKLIVEKTEDLTPASCDILPSTQEEWNNLFHSQELLGQDIPEGII